MQNFGVKFFIAVLLILIGYKYPTSWLIISLTVWAGYFISFITLPLLIAASQNTSLAKIAKRTLSVLGNITTAALISAPIVILQWCWVTYLSNR